jgi:hypothetical protein
MSGWTVENYDRLQSLESVYVPKFEAASPEQKPETLSLEATHSVISPVPFNIVYSNQNALSIILELLH